MEVVTLSDRELVFRLVLAFVLCAALGVERSWRGQFAGLRTHILVGVGACLFTLLSAYGFSAFVPTQPAGNETVVPVVDPTRIAAQIVTGVGFLGAGAILREGANVRGITTAAALWMAAAIGMGCGIGFYLGTITTTVLVFVALVLFRPLGDLVHERAQRRDGADDDDDDLSLDERSLKRAAQRAVRPRHRL